MTLVSQADFRKVDRLWGLDLKKEITYIGARYAEFFDFPQNDVIKIVRALRDNTDIYVLGGGTYQRLPLGGDHINGMVDFPLATSQFHREGKKLYPPPKSAIYLPPFPVSDPHKTLRDFSEAFLSTGWQEVPRDGLVAMFRAFYGGHTVAILFHELGHLLPKYWRVDNGRDEPSPNRSINPRERLADEAACMFYTDATYDREMKTFELTEDSGRIWRKAIEEFGEKSARQMFLEGDYSPLLSREDFMYLLDEWKAEITRTKQTSLVEA